MESPSEQVYDLPQASVAVETRRLVGAARTDRVLNSLLLFALLAAAVTLTALAVPLTTSSYAVLALTAFVVLWNAILLVVMRVQGATVATVSLFGISAALLVAAAGAAQGVTDGPLRVGIQTLLAVAAALVLVESLRYAAPASRRSGATLEAMFAISQARSYMNTLFLYALLVAALGIAGYLAAQSGDPWALATVALVAFVLAWDLILIPLLGVGFISTATLTLLGISAALLVVAAGISSQAPASPYLVGLQALLAIAAVWTLCSTLWFFQFSYQGGGDAIRPFDNAMTYRARA